MGDFFRNLRWNRVMSNHHARRTPGPDRAEQIAVGRLDLDHLGAEIAQHLAGIGAEHDGGEIENPDALE